MKGYGFPSNNNQSNYKADTSKKKTEVINILQKSEQLWNEEGKQEESLVYLRKGINVLQFIVENETIQKVKASYFEKLKELRGRLQNRQTNKEEQKYVAQNGGGYQKTNKGSNNENNALKGQMAEAIVSEKPNVKWQDISGLENAKNSLKEAVILPIKESKTLEGHSSLWTSWYRKTFLAKACATQAEGTFFSVSSSDLMSKYVGQSERSIKQLFALARQRKPSIIFIDEIDSMCGNRNDGENEASRRVKTEFLVQMQGVGHDDTGVLVLGATNLPWALDPAIRRRFERRAYISLPEYEARYGMLKKNLKDNPNNITDEEIQKFTKMTQGYSGSDISILVRDAVYQPIRRFQTATKFKEVNGKYTPCRPGEDGVDGNWMSFSKEKVDIGIITKQDLETALKRTKPSVDGKQLKQYEEFTGTFGQDG